MNYYVYQYNRKDGTPYYIGKGKDKRAWQSHRRANGTQLLPKDKSRIKIVKDKLTEAQAQALEKKLIKKFGRKDLGTGILRNVSDGGEGASGYKQSKSTIEKRAAKMRGRKLSPDHIQKLIENHHKKQPGYTAPDLGDRHPMRQKNVIKKFKGDNNYQTKPEFKYNSQIYSWKNKNTGECVTMTHLSFYRKFNLRSSNVVRVIRGQAKSVSGWELIK